MGTIPFKKDPNVDLWIEIEDKIYLPSQEIEGHVYVNAKNEGLYEKLSIRLQGQEFIEWSEGSGDGIRQYKNKKQIYKDQFILHNFPKKINVGQYDFPFKTTLPQDLPKSLYYSKSHYIRYPLTCILESSDKNNDNQLYNIDIIIGASHSDIISAQTGLKKQFSLASCWCCWNIGSMELSLSCNKDHVKVGEFIDIQAKIGNVNSKRDIKSFQIVLNQKRVMNTLHGYSFYMGQNKKTLHYYENAIKAGKNQSIHFKVKIPQDLKYSTTFGNITGLWYQIVLYCEQSWDVVTTCFLELPISIETHTKQFFPIKKYQRPKNWQPQEMPIIIHNNLKKYECQTIKQATKLQSRNSSSTKQRSIFRISGNQIKPHFGKDQLTQIQLNVE